MHSRWTDPGCLQIESKKQAGQHEPVVSTNNQVFMKITDQVKKLTEQEADKENIDAVLKDVTGYYNNKCILIYSLAAKRFASARLNIEDVPVCCSTNNQDAWEKFQIVVDKEG